MNQIERYSDRELQEMQELCLYQIARLVDWSDIYKIALVEINRELDKRKIRKEGING